MSAQATPIPHTVAHTASVSQTQFGLAHSILGEFDDQSHPENSQHHNKGSHHGGEHAEDCTHCEGYLAVTPNSDTMANFTVPLPSLEKATLPVQIQIPKTRANMSPSALAGLRWLHPPVETPVSLKNLLLH